MLHVDAAVLVEVRSSPPGGRDPARRPGGFHGHRRRSGIEPRTHVAHPYAEFIDKVAKPARYLGGEYQSVVKDPATVAARVCLAFPDVYDIGMSHLGTKILYSLLNKQPDIACERAFAPWLDMEAELRARGLGLTSLETFTPLAEFDVLGVSLQYELTFTNLLTLLDLGGLPLRTVDRAADAPLVLVGGSVASHPEPVAPFIDAAFLGEAEATLPDLVRAWAGMRAQIRAGARTRADALAELASRFALYVPALYATEVDADTGMVVVGAPLDPRVPARVVRAMVPDLDAYPFPVDAPVPYAEAVFERASVEIARGCTEGCRFCQAGMIYRPVRERSPQSIADSLIGGVDRAGYEETGLTCLSTADFSSIVPLVKHLAGELRQRGVSMSVASLRAYGLADELLDELATTRIAGLTFAPEAGTQRMRDVVNKNITEEHIADSARRVFGRGWHRVKLYFMIGLPTEADDDVVGIVDTGQRMLVLGRDLIGNKAEVTVSVSSHVPKPHTPFQWCGQDGPDEITRKQRLLRGALRDRKLRLKVHHGGISFVEGILARGDRRLADVIEAAWKDGARFDGWDEVFDDGRWARALETAGLDWRPYLATRPVTARLPWDHLDVGLEDGFLLGEYRKAVRGRASPPCGKVAGMLVHHAHLAAAEPDQRRLVCYDCGVACDLSKMRQDRLVALRALGAVGPAVVVPAAPARADAAALELPGDVGERGGGSPAERDEHDGDERSADASPARAPRPDARDNARRERVRLRGFVGADTPYTRYRIWFAKVDRVAFLGHLDLGRLWARIFRRAELELAMSRGFSPKPRIAFGPALGLGVPSLGEVIDVDLEHAPIVDGRHARVFRDQVGARVAVPAAEVAARLAEVCPDGLQVTRVEEIAITAPGLGRLAGAIDLLIDPAADGMRFDPARLGRVRDRFLGQASVVVARAERTVDVRALVQEVEVIPAAAAEPLRRALDWPVGEGLLRARVSTGPQGSARPLEVARALGVAGGGEAQAGAALAHVSAARLARLGVVLAEPVVTLAPPMTPAAEPGNPQLL